MTAISFPYIILGAGPAGLQLGYFFQQSGTPYLILEAQEQVGSFFTRYPRKRTLISFNKTASIYDDPEIQLRWDWNSLLTDNYEFLFRQYSKRLYPDADELIHYLTDFAAQYALNIHYNMRIAEITKNDTGFFHLQASNGMAYTCRCLVLATGFGKEYVPDIPGFELVTEHYGNVSLNPEDFAGQRVLILGKGNSAFEIADTVLDTAALLHVASPKPLQLAWKTKHPGHLRADHTRLLDTYQLKLLNSLLDCTINWIACLDDKFLVSLTYTHADGETDELLYDRIINCTGFQFDDSIFAENCRPALTLKGRLPQMTSMWESTTVSDLFFAGTLMQARDFKRTSSAFIDGFRYNIRTLFHFLQTRYAQRPLPHTTHEATADCLTQAALARICRTSGLWAQFSFLCDLIVVDTHTQQAHYYCELPVDYVHDSELGMHPHYYMITFEWGSWSGDAFAIDRHPSNEQAQASVFLHPVVRRYAGACLLAEHHMLEDLFGMYSQTGALGDMVHGRHSPNRPYRNVQQYHLDEHERPLRAFFAYQLEIMSG